MHRSRWAHQLFAKRSLRTRLLVLLLPIVCVTLVAVGYVSYVRAVAVVRTQKTEILKNYAEKIETGVLERLNGAVRNTEMLLYVTAIREIIVDPVVGGASSSLSAYSNPILRFQAIRDYFFVLKSQFGYSDIRVYSDESLPAYQNTNASFFPLARLPLDVPVTLTLQSRQDQVKIADTYRRQVYSASVPLLSVVRLLTKGPDNAYAAIVIDIDPAKLLSGWAPDFLDEYTIGILTREGSFIASSANHPVDSVSTELVDKIFSSSEFEYNGRFYVVRSVPARDWMLYFEVPSAYLHEAFGTIFVSTLALTLIACALVVLSVTMVAVGVTRRVNALTRLIRADAVQDNLTHIISLSGVGRPNSNDEMDVLLTAYNHLIERVQSLTAANEIAIRAEGEMRYYALQSQINPHFLNNTLGSVQGFIDTNDRQSAADLLLRLAEFFRRTLGSGDFLIALEEELETISTYLSIQQSVYENRFSFSIHVQDTLRGLIIPKFLLQPIVENALHHGAREAAGYGLVKVWGKMDGATARICVEDNGPGFSQAFLSSAEKGEAAQMGRAGHGLGLLNVRLRTRHHFGEEAHLLFENLHPGARVTLEIPWEERT